MARYGRAQPHQPQFLKIHTGYVAGPAPLTANGSVLISGSASFASVMALSSGPTYEAQVAEDTPVNWWRFLETSGTSAADSGSGGNTGTYTGGEILDQKGLPGSKDKSIEQSASTTGLMSVPSYNPTNIKSVEIWVKFPGSGSWANSSETADLLGNGSAASGSGGVFGFLLSYGTNLSTTIITLFFGVNGGSAGVDVNANLTLDKLWHHLVGTYDGTTVTLYVDGVSVGTPASYSTAMIAGDGVVAVGYETQFGFEYIDDNVSVAEAALYTQALSATKVATHYSLGTATPPQVVISGTAAFGTLALTANGSVVISGAAEQTAEDALTASGDVIISGAAAITDIVGTTTWALAADGAVVISGAAIQTQLVTGITANGDIVISGSAVQTQQGGLTANGGINISGAASLTATVALQAAGAVVISEAPTDYFDTVLADSPLLYWRLDETSGTTAADSSGNSHPGTEDVYDGTLTQNVTGLLTGVSDTAVSLGGGTNASNPARIYSPEFSPGPQVFTLECWIKTTSTIGGGIVNFGDNPTANSAYVDRQIYMGNDGKIGFYGVTSGGGVYAFTSASGGYNDGNPHHVVVTLSSAGTFLYVDGVQVATNANSSAYVYNGYWIFGGDTQNTTVDTPTDTHLAFTLDEAAVYTTALSATRILAHYKAGIGSGGSGSAVLVQALTANGSVVISGSAVQTQIETGVTASGDVVISGAANIIDTSGSTTWALAASGNVVISGAAVQTQLMTGLTASGDVVVSATAVFSPIVLAASGNVIVSGAAVEMLIQALSASGSVLISASALDTLVLALQAAGGVVISASAVITVVRALSGTGAVVISGSAIQTSTTIFSATGKVVVSASALDSLTQVLTASGNVVVSATATFVAIQALVGAGIVIISGSDVQTAKLVLMANGAVLVSATAALIATQILSASGAVVLSGSALQNLLMALSAFGNVVISGSDAQTSRMALTSNGDVIISGNAALSGTSVFALSASGDVIISGTALIALAIAFSASGNVKIAGSATFTALLILIASGNVVLTGNAALTAFLVLAGAGQAKVSGTASQTSPSALTCSGNVILSGSVSESANLVLMGNGAVLISGSGNIGIYKLLAAVGLVVISGSSQESLIEVLTAAGQVLIFGGGSFTFTEALIAVGLVVISGNAFLGILVSSMLASGNVVISGSAAVFALLINLGLRRGLVTPVARNSLVTPINLGVSVTPLRSGTVTVQPRQVAVSAQTRESSGTL